MPAQWSKPVAIDVGNVEKVPHEYGVYEIGFQRLGWFQTKYISRANAASESLQSHFQRYAEEDEPGKARRKSTAALCADALECRESQRLHFRYIVTDHAACIEARMLTRYSCGLQTRYSWNKRPERAVCRIHPNGCSKKTKNKDTELIFCTEHGCACLEQPHDAGYIDQDGWCLLVPQLANLVPQDTGLYQLGYLDDAGGFVPRYVNSVVRDVGTLRAKFRKYADGRGAFFEKVSPFERHRALCFSWQRITESDTMTIACRLAAYCVYHCMNATARDSFVNYSEWRKWCEVHLRSCRRCMPSNDVDSDPNDADETQGDAEPSSNEQRLAITTSVVLPQQPDDAEAAIDVDEPYTSRSTYMRSQARRQTSTMSRTSQFG